MSYVVGAILLNWQRDEFILLAFTVSVLKMLPAFSLTVKLVKEKKV